MGDKQPDATPAGNTDAISIAPISLNELCVDLRRIVYIVKFQLLGAVSMSDAEFESTTGASVSVLPEMATGVGVGSLAVPQPNWYYRILRGLDPDRIATRADPIIAEILRGADIVPKVPLTENFDPLEMTYRHLSPVSDVQLRGTDRISTASELEAFKTVLKDRGTGEIVRVDVDKARKLGVEFLEHDTIMQHLEQYERRLLAELETGRTEGWGKGRIQGIENRLRWLRTARDYAIRFKEGEAVGRIPSAAITKFRDASSSLERAILHEKLFLGSIKFLRFGGRVFLIYGAMNSINNVCSAPQEQRARVATREAGGWAFSFAGAEAGAALFGGLGAAAGIETGPGAVVTAAIGGLVGGIVGFFCGEETVDEIYSGVESLQRAPELVRDTPRLIDTIIQMFGSDEARRAQGDLREIETGERPVWDLL